MARNVGERADGRDRASQGKGDVLVSLMAASRGVLVARRMGAETRNPAFKLKLDPGSVF